MRVKVLDIVTVTLTYQDTSEPEVPWGDHGIDALVYGEAEPDTPDLAAITTASPSTPDLSPEQEAWLGHA